MTGPADRPAVEHFCRERLGVPAAAHRLAGDASTRVYWRLVPAAGPSLILMDTGVPIEPDSDAFLNARSLFASVGLPVPLVERVLGPEGIVVLEDLGDELLQARLSAGWTAEADALYERAVDLLLVLHVEGTLALRSRPDHPAARQALDRDRFLFELNFMLEHFAAGLRGAPLTPADRTTLAGFLERLAAEAAGFGRVLCHRDYHSRNLMVLPARTLAIVDFQDARWGPVTYDLASLLRDSYVELPDPVVDRLLERFRSGLLTRLRSAAPDLLSGSSSALGSPSDPNRTAVPVEPLGGVLSDPAGFRRRFDLTCLQRNLKALGTFGYQVTVRNNPVYLPYVAPTAAHVRRNLSRFPEFAASSAILDRILP